MKLNKFSIIIISLIVLTILTLQDLVPSYTVRAQSEIECVGTTCLDREGWEQHAQETNDPSVEAYRQQEEARQPRERPDNNEQPPLPPPPPNPTTPPPTNSTVVPTQTPTPSVPDSQVCNVNIWSDWNPICTSQNCDIAVQNRQNCIGETQTQNCTCIVTNRPANLSWFKTKGGDVHSNSDIVTSLPSLREKFATFLVTNENLSSFANGTFNDARPDLASEMNWYWYSPTYGSVNYPELTGFYDYYTHLKPAASKKNIDNLTNNLLNQLAGNSPTIPIIQADPLSGTVVIDESLSLTGNKGLILYVNGDLVINNNIFFNDDAGVVFVVKGNVIISSIPIEVDGLFLVDKNFSTTDKAVNTPLQIKGSVYTSKNGKIFDQSRTVTDLLIPSEYFIFQPKYFVTFSSVLGRTSLLWHEVAP